MNTASPMPDEAIPGLDDLNDFTMHEPMSRKPKPQDVVFLVSQDWQINMAEALEALKAMNFAEVRLD